MQPALQLRDPGPVVRPEWFDALEELAGAKLPAEFRTFYAAHNGGKPETPRFCFRFMGDDTTADVADFLRVGPLDYDFDLDTVAGQHNNLAGVGPGAMNMPPDLLPFALVEPSDVILLRPADGAVLFWAIIDGDFEAALESGQVEVIADSFREFLTYFRTEGNP